MKLYKSLSGALKERKEVEALKLFVKGETFPEEIFDLTELRELYLEGECTFFPDPGHHLPKLKILSIKWPMLKDNLSYVFRLSSLQNLKIIDTPLLSLVFPLGIATTSLTSLTVKNCSLSFLPEEFSILRQLEELNLSENMLNKLPASFVDLKFLKRLNLDSNKFSVFPDVLSRMSSLSHLSIDNNLFSDEEKAKIQRNYHIWPN